MRNGGFFCQKILQNRAIGFDLMLIFAKCFFVQNNALFWLRAGTGQRAQSRAEQAAGASGRSKRQQKWAIGRRRQANKTHCIDDLKERCPNGNTMPAEPVNGRRFPR
jgi:hypothetical protein